MDSKKNPPPPPPPPSPNPLAGIQFAKGPVSQLAGAGPGAGAGVTAPSPGGPPKPNGNLPLMVSVKPNIDGGVVGRSESGIAGNQHFHMDKDGKNVMCMEKHANANPIFSGRLTFSKENVHVFSKEGGEVDHFKFGEGYRPIPLQGAPPMMIKVQKYHTPGRPIPSAPGSSAGSTASQSSSRAGGGRGRGRGRGGRRRGRRRGGRRRGRRVRRSSSDDQSVDYSESAPSIASAAWNRRQVVGYSQPGETASRRSRRRRRRVRRSRFSSGRSRYSGGSSPMRRGRGRGRGRGRRSRRRYRGRGRRSRAYGRSSWARVVAGGGGVGVNQPFNASYTLSMMPKSAMEKFQQLQKSTATASSSITPSRGPSFSSNMMSKVGGGGGSSAYSQFSNVEKSQAGSAASAGSAPGSGVNRGPSLLPQRNIKR